jgi:hypothetical protein
MDSRLIHDGLLIPGAMELRVSPRRLDTTQSHASRRLNDVISELIFINDSVCVESVLKTLDTRQMPQQKNKRRWVKG